MATIDGTPYDDVMTPTVGQYTQNGTVVSRLQNRTTILADLVHGLAGNDVIHGSGGADDIFGDDGDDTLFGGNGDDTLHGGLGNDEEHGGSRADQLLGDEGSDTLLGDNGDDTVVGDALSAITYGDEESILGEDDSIEGGAGGDSLVGDQGSATSFAYISGIVGGTDTIAGGSGDDIIAGDQGSAATSSYFVSYILGGSDTIVGESGDDSIAGDQWAAATYGAAGRILGGTDTIAGGSGDDSIAGNQIFAETFGVSADIGAFSSGFFFFGDIVEGGTGDDTIAGDEATAITHGGVPDPYFSGFSNIFGDNDTISGDSGDDSLAGDQLLAETFGRQSRIHGGNDTIAGGSGDDTIWGDQSSAITHDANSNIGPSDYSYGSYSYGDTIDGGAGDDDIAGDESFAATFGYGSDIFGDDDVITGSRGNDTIVGDQFTAITERDGADIIGGDDSITGGAGRDSLVGDGHYAAALNGDGRRGDVIGGGDTIEGGDDNDTLRGDWLSAYAVFGGNDLLSGGVGNDILDGQGGDDTLAGGTGNDNLDGGDGFDLAVFEGAAGVSVNLGTGQAAGEGKDTLAHIEAAQGGAGDDTLIGDGGANLLAGDGGDDRLIGAGGDDTLVDGAGNDLLDGGGGLDLAVFDVPDGIYVDLGLGLAAVEGDDTLIGIEGVQGGAGNDTLIGDGNANLLLGVGGDDSLVGGAGDDTLDGGAGTDVAAFAGKIADYEITNSAGIITVADLNPLVDGNDGTDTLTTVEQLRFADGGVIVSIDLATLDGNNGFTLIGINEGDQSGYSVSSAGDVNGDGFDDVIVGAFSAESAGGADSEGESYVVFGKASWVGAPSIDLATLDGTNGFRLAGIGEHDYSGKSVSSAGDVNGDGFADLIIGARYAERPGGTFFEGASYVVFGKASWTPAIDLASLDGTNGFTLVGINEDDRAGWSVSSAGDVNGDGLADVIVGAALAETSGGAEEEGETYVVFGKTSWAGTPSLDLATINGTNGFRLVGIDANDYGGYSVSSAGDVNGDGFDDVIVGAQQAESAGGADYEGESYVVFGKASWAGTQSLDLANLNGNNGFRLIGADERDFSARAVSSAGDVNGDGFADVIICAPGAESPGGDKGEGESYVVFGKASWAGTTSIDLATLDGTNGFTLTGNHQYSLTRSVSSAGDVNGDGFDDMIIGARYAGETYLVFGKADWTGTPTLDFATLDGTNGLRLIGVDANDFSGNSVSSAGDVNGDGFDDLIVGAFAAESAGGADSEGESYVVFGGNFTGGVVFAGTNGADNLIGTAAAEIFVGGQANDTLVGNGGADAFQGGEGDDTMAVTSLDFFLVDGGRGTDTLRLDGAGLALDLTTLADNHTRSIEQIDITGNGSNTLTVSVLDVLNLSDESNQLLVDGDAGDTVERGAGWTTGGTTAVDGQTYQVYAAGSASLLVDTDVVTTV
jgi:Ca2+-binding RTX toxin-like protein